MTKNKISHPEGYIYEQFVYRSYLVVYPNSTDMNELYDIPHHAENWIYFKSLRDNNEKNR